MLFEIWLFYLIYSLILISAILVILSENAVYSVLFLILTFSNTILLLLLMGAEFFAFLLLIVYVGAIAVLFLFVVMMLNLKKTSFFNLNNNIVYFIPLIFIFMIYIYDFFIEINMFFDILKNIKIKMFFINWLLELNTIDNIKVLGNVLYTNFCSLFIISSFILLVSMIGVIVLTIHQKTNYVLKRQNINNQLVRNSKNIVKFIYLRK